MNTQCSERIIGLWFNWRSTFSDE